MSWHPARGRPCHPSSAGRPAASPVERGQAGRVTRYLQFFDPASGLSIGHPQATAAA